MKVDKSMLPAHREPSDHSRQWYQTDRNASPSVGQVKGDLFQLMRREVIFCLQLVLAFSVSYTAVQLTRDLLSRSGMIAPSPSSYSARVFWPENTLALFPKPVVPAAQAAEQNAASPKPVTPAAKLAAAPPAKPSLSRTPEARRQAAASLHITPLRNQNAYRWATPARSQYQPRPQAPRYTARRPVRVAARPQPPKALYRRSPRVAAVRPAPVSPAVRPIRRILNEDYKVSKLKSYEEYMSWVRKTLKDYNGG